MKRKFKLLFLLLSAFMLGFGSFITIYAAAPLTSLIDVELEQQESLVNDKIRYVSTLELSGSATLEDITTIDVELSLIKSGQATRNTEVSITKVFDSISGTNGKPQVDNTYYAVYTITNLAASYPGYTLESTFEYNYKDGTSEKTNTISYVIPSAYSLNSGSGSFPTTSPLFADNVQDGQILQCFCWSYNEIMEYLPKIASQGFTAIQTSPVQVCKEATVDELGNGKNAKGVWWAYYQPAAFTIDDTGDNAMGTPEEFQQMCTMAHQYGVKVLVDVVANHLGNQWVADCLCERAYYYEWEIAGMSGPANINAQPGEAGYIPYTGEYWKFDNGTESTVPVIDTYYYADTLKFHPYQVQDGDQPGNVTQGNIGMMDLDTSDPVVQDAVADYLEELISYGVDGFRFDAAKHIETPDDDPSIASDFWPTVMNRANAKAASLGKEIYAYGEILNRPGIDRSLSWYTKYGVAITDSGLGHGIVENGGSGFGSFNGADGNNYIDYKENMVTWAESHDNYMGTQDTHNKSETVINRAYAILAARKDFCTLYCARFEDYDTSTIGNVACLNGWSYDCVGAANKFHNFYAKLDADESCYDSNGYNCIERFVDNNSNQNGIVIVGNAGACSVSTSHLANGTYTDQVTGNTFTVSNGTISGTVGDSCVAVIFNNTSNEVGNVSISSTSAKTFYSASTTATYVINNAKSATLTINGVTSNITSGASITFGYDMQVGDTKTITISATGLDNTVISQQYVYTKVAAPKTYRTYFEKPSDWTSVNAIVFGGSTTQTTLPTTYDSTTGTYYVEYLENTYTKVQFTNGVNKTEVITLEDGATYRLADKSSAVYFANDYNWTTVNVYMWTADESGKNAEWPGIQLTSVDSETGYYMVDTTGYDNIIFNNGSSQTPDIALVSSEYPIVYHFIDGAVNYGYLVTKGEVCEHTYGTPTFTWTGFEATATFVCTNCNKENVITCTITSEITKEATETETGIRTYTATVTLNGNTYTDTKTEVLPLVGSVTTVERVEPTCTTAGNIKYYISGGKYYSDAGCSNEITLESTILPALGHSYELSISGNTYTYACENCDEVINIQGIKIHYDGDTSTYTDIWFWYDGQAEGHNVSLSNTDSYGHYALATTDTFGGVTKLYFIVKNNNWDKDPDGDRYVDLTHLAPDNDGYYHIYLKTGVGTIYTDASQSVIYS